jgi:hypothetical protein
MVLGFGGTTRALVIRSIVCREPILNMYRAFELYGMATKGRFGAFPKRSDSLTG